MEMLGGVINKLEGVYHVKLREYWRRGEVSEMGGKGLTTIGRGVRVTAVIRGRGGGGGCTTANHSQQPPLPFQTNKSKFKYSCE